MDPTTDTEFSRRANGARLEHVELLLVEDDAGDARLTREALKSAKVMVNLTVAGSGEEALEILQRRHGNGDGAPRPHLILLDLNLPGKTGFQTLEELKGDRLLRRIPVVVLTSSSAEEDIVKSYDLQASAFVTKPLGLDGLRKVVGAIDEFWLTVVSLPATGRMEEP